MLHSLRRQNASWVGKYSICEGPFFYGFAEKLNCGSSQLDVVCPLSVFGDGIVLKVITNQIVRSQSEGAGKAIRRKACVHNNNLEGSWVSYGRFDLSNRRRACVEGLPLTLLAAAN